MENNRNDQESNNNDVATDEFYKQLLLVQLKAGTLLKVDS